MMSNDLQPTGSQLQPGSSVLDVMTPGNYADWWRLAGNLSESGILPNALNGKAGAVLSIIARGAFLGIPWPIAVQEAYVVNGRVCWPAAILASIVATSPEFEFFEILEADDEHAVIEAKKHRWDAPREYPVSLADAKRAGYLDGKHSEQWKLRPRFMLIAMARREAARMWDPVRCAGLYTLEELETTRVDRNILTPTNLLEASDISGAASSGVSSADFTETSAYGDLEFRVTAARISDAVAQEYGPPGPSWEENRKAIEAMLKEEEEVAVI